MAESYSVTAVLSARDKNFSSVFGSAQGAADRLAGKLKSGLGFGIMQAVGLKAVNAVTGALGGMFGGAVDAGMTFDASMSQVAATMGKSVSEIQDLRDFALEMGSTTAFSASQAADALNYMALAGYDSEKSMAMLPNVLNLAAAGNMDLARASDMVTDAQSALGLSMDEATTMVDQMAKTASKSNTSVEQLGDAILTIGATARNVKGGTTELNAVLGALADNGIKGAEGGTHLRNILLSLQNPTDDAAAALQKLGVSVYDAEGNMRSTFDIIKDMKKGMEGMDQASKDAMISGIFNKTDLASVNALLNTSEDRFAELTEAIEDCDGAAEKMASTQLDNLQGDVTLFQSALEGLRISIFDNFNGPMRAAVKIATEGLTELKGIVDNLGDAFGGAFSLSELTDALENGGLSGALETVVGNLGKLPEGFKAAGAAAGAIAGVSLANGFLDSDIWKAGIAGLGTFKDAMGMLPGAIKQDLVPVAKGFKDAGYSALNFASRHCPQALTAISDMGDKAKGLTGALKTKTLDRFTSRFPKLTSALGKTGSAFGKAGSGIIKTYGKMGSVLTKTMGVALKAVMPAAAIGAVLAGLGLLYSKFGDQIDGILQMAQEKGPQFITNLVSGITSRLPVLIASGAQLVSGLLSTITANIPAVIAGGVSIITTLVAGVASAAPDLIGKATELIGTFVVSIVSALPQLITAGMELLASIALGVGQNLPVLAQYAMQAVMSFAQGIIGNLPQILASAVQIVNSLVTGIVNMIPVLISSGIQLITYLAQSFIQNLPMIIQTGIQVIGALVMGLIQAVPMIIQGAIELVKSLIDTIINTDWIKVGSDIIDAIGNGIKSGFGGLGSLISGLFSNDTSAEDGGAQQATRAAESTAQAYISNSGLVSSAASQVGTEATTSLTAGLSSGAAEVSSIMSTMGTEGVTAFSASFDGISLDGVGTELSNSINTEFDSGLSQLPEITGNAGDQVVSSLKQSGSQATAAVKSTTTSVINTLKSGVSPAAAAGKSIGNGYTGGIRGASGTARSAGTALKNAGLSGMSGGYSSAYSHGANIGQGLVNGMRSKIGAAWAVAESLAEAADKAIAARAQIGSPSKISTRQGAFIGQGLGNGLADMRSYVAKRAAAVTTSAISTIDEGVQRARSSMAKLVGATAPEMEMRQRSGNMSLNDEYEYRSEAHYTIVVESVMDGRKVGEGVADYVDEAITKKNARNARKRGKA